MTQPAPFSRWLSRSFALGLLAVAPSGRGNPGWAVDACLSRHVTPLAAAQYRAMLDASAVVWLRERDIGRRQPVVDVVSFLHVLLSPDRPYLGDPRPAFRLHRESGRAVVAFAGLPDAPAPARPGNALVEDLLTVFRGGQQLAKDFSGTVDAWEMVGEPDLGYCRDLPDRLAAYQKALYLGIRRGSKNRADADTSTPSNLGRPSASGPLILMGALGYSPGPWLERAARNGLLDYTDAYNFHFYGNAEELAGEIEGHRAAAARWGRPGIPLWITECGLNAVVPQDMLNAGRRQLQADFTISTARQALAAEDVAMFMPFILAHENDPHAMTLAADRPLPAWEAYSRFTRENPWPKRKLADRPADPNPIVVQWLPDNGTTIPHKVSGTYRFKASDPIKGEFRIYNFSPKAVRGRLLGPWTGAPYVTEAGGVGANGDAVITDFRAFAVQAVVRSADEGLEIPGLAMVSVPVEFAAQRDGYFREFCTVEFREASGRGSRVYFGLERWPVPGDFEVQPLRVASPPGGRIGHPMFPDYRVTSRSGPWLGINGLIVRTAAAAALSGASVEAVPPMIAPSSPAELTASINQTENDPLYPPMAVARLTGLPGEGFIRLQLDRPLDRDAKVRVDLVDDEGRRFCIWENFGASYYVTSNEIWLNLADFQNYSWGRTTTDPKLHPSQVTEIQLRFYMTDGRTPPLRLKLDFMRAKNPGGVPR